MTPKKTCGSCHLSLRGGAEAISLLLLPLIASCLAIKPGEHSTEKLSWTPPLVIYASVPDAKGQPASNPSIAVDQKGATNVVWWAKGFGEVYFSRSTDGGK